MQPLNHKEKYDSLEQEFFSNRPNLSQFQLRCLQLQSEQVHAGNGCVVDGTFVDSAGFLPVAESLLTAQARELFTHQNIDTTATDAAQLAQALSHETYFTFPKEVKPASQTIDMVIGKEGHRSIVKPNSVTSLFSGLSIDAAIPLIALGGGIGRLTTSSTNAMNATLYRRMGTDVEQAWQSGAIERFLELRDAVNTHHRPRKLSKKGAEYFNTFNTTSKTIALFHTMNVKELHSLAHNILGYAQATEELRELITRSTSVLSQLHPGMIDPPENYLPRNPLSLAHSDKRQPSTRTDLLEVVKRAGGDTEDGLFVTRPSCELIDPPIDLLNELKNRCAPDFLAAQSVGFKLTGLAYETVLELVAHDEASVNFLPHNALGYMDDTAYRIQGTAEEQAWQKEAILRFLELRQSIRESYQPETLSKTGRALFNGFNLGSRAVSLQFSMQLKDFHKLFIGRLATRGNEADVQDLCNMMCTSLHAIFPEFILDPKSYSEMGNETKYLARSFVC